MDSSEGAPADDQRAGRGDRAIPPTVVDYRLAPLVTARFVGLYLVLLGLAMFLATIVVALLGLPLDLLVALLAIGLVGVFVLGWWLRSRAYVVRVDADGYRVGLVRGAGVKQAGWAEVEDAVTTTTQQGVDCVVLHLHGGRTTTVPVSVLALDREQFVQELQQHLQRGQGLTPLSER